MKCRHSFITILIDFLFKDTKIMTDLQDSLDQLAVVNAKLDNVGVDVDTLVAEVAALQAAVNDQVPAELKAMIDSIVLKVSALDEKFPAPAA